MPSVCFWNVARAGDGAAADDVSQSLEALANRTKADAIVLCEMLKLTTASHAPAFKPGLAPTGFAYLKPQRDLTASPAAYAKATTLRYYMFGKNPGPMPWLVTTRNSRPVVVLSIGARVIILMHAPSVSNSSTPQATQMIAAYTAAQHLHRRGSLTALPTAIFGDLNVDARNNARISSLNNGLHGTALSTWLRVRSGQVTHRGPGHRSELDWALCDPGFACHVTVVDILPRKKVSFHKLDDDDEFNPGDEGVDKHSDHVPVLLSW